MYTYLLVINIVLGGVYYPQPVVAYSTPEECMDRVSKIDQREKANLRLEAFCVAKPNY